jgi:hypothetical protein
MFSLREEMIISRATLIRSKLKSPLIIELIVDYLPSSHRAV